MFVFRDIAPEGENLEETNANLDQLTDLALELQEATGVKLLWATCNLFANPRYTVVSLVIYIFDLIIVHFNVINRVLFLTGT